MTGAAAVGKVGGVGGTCACIAWTGPPERPGAPGDVGAPVGAPALVLGVAATTGLFGARPVCAGIPPIGADGTGAEGAEKDWAGRDGLGTRPPNDAGTTPGPLALGALPALNAAGVVTAPGPPTLGVLPVLTAPAVVTAPGPLTLGVLPVLTAGEVVPAPGPLALTALPVAWPAPGVAAWLSLPRTWSSMAFRSGCSFASMPASRAIPKND
ncbi:MAG: hypothetical protein WB785_13695 [Mycobacterium sp.]|uniref:hypothetical protein n=1 Tax=Mycobacterium sp. TaxID=1785 RepID=UPI003C3F943D